MLVVTLVVSLRGRAAAGPPDAAARPDDPGHRVLRRPDPRPRAVCLPGLRPGDHPRRVRLALAGGLRGLLGDGLPEHVRGADQPVLPATRGSRDWLGIGTALRSELARRGPRRASTAPSSCGPSPSPERARARLAADEAEDERRSTTQDGRLGWEDEDDGRGRRAPARAGDHGRRPRARAGRGRASDRGRASPPSRYRPAAAAAAAALARMPSWTPRATFDELGVVGWFRERAAARRRSGPTGAATLRHEGGGRLDRLDLWIVVVLVLGTMVLRTFRLDRAVPDALRRGLPRADGDRVPPEVALRPVHDIYEWTHPHLAKYAMAAGIVLWGGDDVAPRATSGSPSRAVGRGGRRRVDPPAPRAARAGERLHVATGTEIRTYDLRDPRAHLDRGGTRRGRPGHRRDGEPAGHRLRRRPDRDPRPRPRSATAGSTPDSSRPTLATVDHPVDHLLVDERRRVRRRRLGRPADDGRHRTPGTVVGSIDLAGIADLAPGGSGDAVVATVDEVTDPTAVASSLAEILPGETRRTTRTASPRRRPGRRSSSASRGAPRPGPSSRPRSPTARCRASAWTT